MLQFEELKLRLEGLFPDIEDLANASGIKQMERETELDARLAALKAKNAPAAPAPLAVETPTQTL